MILALSGHSSMADTSPLFSRRETRTERKQYKFRPSVSKNVTEFAELIGLSETDVVEKAANQAANSLPLLKELYDGELQNISTSAIDKWVNAGDLLSIQEGDFLVYARTKAMVGDGVSEGDLLHLRPQKWCENGDVVAISLKTSTGERVTMRRIEVVDGKKLFG